MRFISIIVLMIITVENTAQQAVVTNGQLQQLKNFSSQYVNPRNIDIWLPDGYDENKSYAVIYMHDAQMLFDSTITWNGQEWRVDEIMSKLLKDEQIRDCIVVGIWNVKPLRYSDYLPQKALQFMSDELADSLIQNKLMGEPRADAYLEFIIKELKPFIDSIYSTYSDRSNTFVMGSSMGGLISMYAICEYPKIFGGAACLSTHWIGNPVSWNIEMPQAYLTYLRENIPDKNSHLFYFDHGTETLDQYYEPYQKIADSLFYIEGYDARNYKSLKFPAEAHDEYAWANRFHIPVLFLLGKD